MVAAPNEKDERVIEKIRRLLAEIRMKSVTGQARVVLDVQQGGVTHQKHALEWSEK